MGYEVEVKYKVADPSTVRGQLRSLGATDKGQSDHADLYLAHPDRDFKETDEALRLRRIGSENRVTYKGPKYPGPTKTREEIEIGFESGPEQFNQLSLLFARLGFRPVALVTKTRDEFEVADLGRPVSVLLDNAGELGQFVEIEALAVDEADLSDAQSVVLKLAEHLGLSDVEPRSYLRMTLERLSSNATTQSDDSLSDHLTLGG